jgi:predicted metal-dependent HD superfamily phosphohydrolase
MKTTLSSRPALQGGWTACVTALGCPPPLAQQAFADLLQRYAEPQRRYHTLSHIANVLAVLERLNPDCLSTPALFLAAWLHDVVYDPRAGDNEERSADHARSFLPLLHVPAATVDETARLILLTKGHQAGPDDGAGQILLDADLAILGSSEADYDGYAAAIREEYSWVPEDAYRHGRSRVLRQFLERPFLFATPAQRAAAELQARLNLQRELAILADRGSSLADEGGQRSQQR